MPKVKKNSLLVCMTPSVAFHLVKQVHLCFPFSIRPEISTAWCESGATSQCTFVVRKSLCIFDLKGSMCDCLWILYSKILSPLPVVLIVGNSEN